MDTETVASKRQNGSNKMPLSNGDDSVARVNPSKRRRLHEPIQEPEPIDIDRPVEKSKSKTTSESSKESEEKQRAMTAIPSSSVPPASTSTAISSGNIYVPKPPPTAEQVADLLLQPNVDAKKKKDKTRVTPPKPPPPTPALLSPRQSTISTTTTTTLSTRTAQHRRRRLFYRAITFVWLVLMVKVTLGFIASIDVLLQQIRATATPTREVFRMMIPSFLHAKPPATRIYAHVKPPAHVTGNEPHEQVLANLTLRDFLQDEEGFHLALAPAFFGIYAYVGTFMAWDDTLYFKNMKSVVGASAGAMAAVILAAGIEPHRVADLGRQMTLQKFADPPGIGGVFKGDKFEEIMETFLRSENPNSTLQMEDSHIPVAVTAFDLKAMQGRILTRGSMAKAARASATFPLLFQPVQHDNGILIDGGITDMLGLRGLAAWETSRPKRVLNVAVGGFMTSPPGPQSMPEGVHAREVLSVSILNTPQCGPWAMANGPRAIEAARRAMVESLDLPLYHGNEKGHYELHVDASSHVE